MKSFAFFRKNDQIFARFIMPNAKYETHETVFDCDKEFGAIIIHNGNITTETFDSYEDAMSFVAKVHKEHSDYKTEYEDETDFIFKKENEYITIKIVY